MCYANYMKYNKIWHGWPLILLMTSVCLSTSMKQTVNAWIIKKILHLTQNKSKKKSVLTQWWWQASKGCVRLLVSLWMNRGRSFRVRFTYMLCHHCICISPIKLWVIFSSVMRCTRYNFTWWSLTVTCWRSEVYSVNFS